MPAKVFVATPHNRLAPEMARAVLGQTYAEPVMHVFLRDNPEPVPGHNIIRAQSRLREMFLAGDYDAYWSVENDIIVPPDALERMLAVDADIVYGVYCFRRGVPSVNIMLPGTRDPQTTNPRQWAHDFTAGAVVECGGLGLGCTLIRRHVLERLPFRSAGGGGDADSCLAVDAPAAGFRQAAHLGVVCGHKHTTGLTYWPVAERPFWSAAGERRPQLRAVLAVHPFAVWDDLGMTTVVGQGQRAEIDVELAASLAASGQVALL